MKTNRTLSAWVIINLLLIVVVTTVAANYEDDESLDLVVNMEEKRGLEKVSSLVKTVALSTQN